MLELARQFLDDQIDRRAFMTRLMQAGMTAAGAATMVNALAMELGPSDDMKVSSNDNGSRILHNATGGEIIVEHLHHWDMPFLFGLSGSEEVGLWDALVDRPYVHYITAVHEHVAMAMADGYSKSTGKTSFVCLHSIAGAAYAFGQLVGSYRDRTPVVVTAGRQTTDTRGSDGFLEAANLHMFPDEYTQWTWDVMTVKTLPDILRKSFMLSEAPPGGPSFVTFSKDIYEQRIERAEILPRSRSKVSRDVEPSERHIKEVVDGLLSAEMPALFLGNECIKDEISTEVAAIAETVGAPVMTANKVARVFPTNHPSYVGQFMDHRDISDRIDTFWSIGGHMFYRGYTEEPLIRRDARIFHTGLDNTQVGRNYPIDSAAIANIKTSAKAVLEELQSRNLKTSAIRDRRQWMSDYAAKRSKTLDEEAKKVWNQSPISTIRLLKELDGIMANDAMVVTEVVTADDLARRYLTFDYQTEPEKRRRNFDTVSGILGWGMSAAVGVSLGNPDKETWCLSGDGCVNFGLQALWSAARYEAPIGFIVFNNGQYQANRLNMNRYPGRMIETGIYPGVNLGNPDINYVSLADGYGIEGERISDPDKLGAALKRAKRALQEGRPYMVDIKLETRFPGAESASEWFDSWSIAKQKRRIQPG